MSIITPEVLGRSEKLASNGGSNPPMSPERFADIKRMLQYMLRDTKRLYFCSDVGYKLNIPPRPLAKAWAALKKKEFIVFVREEYIGNGKARKWFSLDVIRSQEFLMKHL